MRFSYFIICFFYLTIFKVQSQKTNTTPASSTFANNKALYLNLRDLLDPCAAISIGCYYPIKTFDRIGRKHGTVRIDKPYL